MNFRIRIFIPYFFCYSHAVDYFCSQHSHIMHFMYKTIFISLLFLCSSVAGFAFPHASESRDMQDFAKQEVREISETCQLSPEQQSRVLDIYTEFGPQFMVVFQQNDSNFQKMNNLIKDLENRRSQSIKRILSSEQSAKYDAYLTRMAQQRWGQDKGNTTEEKTKSPSNPQNIKSPAPYNQSGTSIATPSVSARKTLVDDRLAKAEAKAATKAAKANYRNSKKSNSRSH